MAEMQICKEKSSKKRPLESPPPTPPPSTSPPSKSPPSTSPPSKSPPSTSPTSPLPPSPPQELMNPDFKDAIAKCAEDIHISFLITVNFLVDEGFITDRYKLLRTDESFKQSWDTGDEISIAFEELISSYSDESKRDQVDKYMNYAAVENRHLKVPPPEDPADEQLHILRQGLYVIYPEGQDQKDPIFREEPHFWKFVALIPKLGAAAVEFHNYLTGSKLEFSDFKKAHYFPWLGMQYFFITLEAYKVDEKGIRLGKPVTCQSTLVCLSRYNQEIRRTIVKSFQVLNTE